MGQGIISRSNPGNSGDKVGDIRITTRNTLGEKWALCNGTMYEGKCALQKDPLNNNCWRDTGIDFSSNSATELFGLNNDEGLTNYSVQFVDIIRGKKAHYAIYRECGEDSGLMFNEYYRIVTISFDAQANLIHNLSTIKFNAYQHLLAAGGVDEYKRIILNDETRIVQCTGIGMYGICHIVFDMDTGDVINIYYKRNDMEYESYNILSYTKNKILVDMTLSGATGAYIFLCTKDGIIEVDQVPAGAYMNKSHIADYVNDTVYLYLEKGEGNESIFINNNNSIIHTDGIKYYNEEVGGYGVLECLIGDYLMFTGASGPGIGRLSNASEISKSLGVPSVSMINSIHVFIDRSSNLLIIQVYDQNLANPYTGIFTGSEANLEYIYNNSQSIQNRFTTIDGPSLRSGDYTADPFYFCAKGDTSICFATLPEISVDDESYCFIKIKD